VKKLLFLVILAFILVCLVGLAACTSPETTTQPSSTSTSGTPTPTTTTTTTESKYGGTLRLADAVGPNNVGWPGDTMFGIGGPFQSVFYDTVLKEDAGGTVKPNLVTDWELAPDMKSITLTLRQGVKFHDGSDWNADAAKFNFDVRLEAKDSAFANVSSAEIVDDYTVRLNLIEFQNTIYDSLSQTLIISKEAYDKNGEDWMRTHAVGTGPFQFDSFTPDVSVKGVRFDDYWGGKPYLDAIVVSIITDPTTRANAFEAGDQDIAGGDLSKTEYDLMQKGYEVVNGYISIYCLIPDSKNPDSPFADIKVRQAVSYAIDRDSIVDSLGYGWWIAVNQFALPGSPVYDPTWPANPYDVDKAKQLLDEAGYSGGLTSTIIVDTFVSNKDAVTAMQGFLSKVGIEVDLNMADMGTSVTYMTEGWHNALFGAARAGLVGNVNSGLSNWSDDSHWHSSLLKTAEYNQLYNESLTADEYDPALAKKAIQYLYDNTSIIPIYAVSRGYVLQPNVHDTGFYTQQNFWYWEPAKTWLSK
jgi:peptide/nickel transport system substrate-binding protein